MFRLYSANEDVFQNRSVFEFRTLPSGVTQLYIKSTELAPGICVSTSEYYQGIMNEVKKQIINHGLDDLYYWYILNTHNDKVWPLSELEFYIEDQYVRPRPPKPPEPPKPLAVRGDLDIVIVLIGRLYEGDEYAQEEKMLGFIKQKLNDFLNEMAGDKGLEVQVNARRYGASNAAAYYQGKKKT